MALADKPEARQNDDDRLAAFVRQAFGAQQSFVCEPPCPDQDFAKPFPAADWSDDIHDKNRAFGQFRLKGDKAGGTRVPRRFLAPMTGFASSIPKPFWPVDA
jgi:hypothetical protein